MLCASVACWQIASAREEIPYPSMMAGHSFGEYSALVRGWNGVNLQLLYYINDGGTLKWDLLGTRTADTILVNTWYNLEVEFDADADEHNFWRNDTLLVTDTTAYAAGIQHVGIGCTVADGWTTDGYFDCFVIDTSKIGLEAVGINSLRLLRGVGR